LVLESILSIKKGLLQVALEGFFVDLLGKTTIIIIAFSFFAPAFLFLLPSLRKKAGVFKKYCKTSEVVRTRDMLIPFDLQEL
jgi:hypothetical protein